MKREKANIQQSTSNIQHRTGVPAWVCNGALPDSDMTVLIRVDDAEDPMVIGYHDGEDWVTPETGTISKRVMGWMDLDAAAAILDGGAA
jgi:hypothetical protein